MGEVSDALRWARRERNRERVPSRSNLDDAPTSSPASRSSEDPLETPAVLVNLPDLPVDRFRHFALQVRRSLEERGARSVLITSALPGEGKTLVVCNLALALASMAGESRIALLDLDLHHPGVATALGVTPRCGVERVLLGEKNLRAARVGTDLPALDLFAVSAPVSRPHEVLARPALRSLISELTEQYAMVVCDGPPALPVPDVELVVPHIGACVLVAKAGSTRRSAFRELVAMIPRETLLGTFLNFSSPSRYAKGYSNYYVSDGETDGLSKGGAAAREGIGTSDE